MKYCAALALMLVVACAAGGARKAAMAPQETSAMPSVAPSSPKKAELDKLYEQVDQERESMGLPAPMVSGEPGAIPMATQPTTQNDSACHPAQSETCTSSCKLSDSICTNAEKICKLAKDLEPDEDAAAKCVKADKTCKAGHEKCCGCML